MEAVPAIDLLGGKAVRLRQGDYGSATEYSADPIATARGFSAAGLRRLHLVDLDGAKDGSTDGLRALRRICAETPLLVTYGGGMRRLSDVEAAFAAGASEVVVGSLAVQRPELFREILVSFGGSRIVLAADVREGRVSVSGWTEDSGTALVDLVLQYSESGLEWLLCTEISRDGMLTGPAFELYRQLRRRFSGLKIIASGGITSAADLAALAGEGISRAIVGRALYEKRIEIRELRECSRSE
jgi:phosphoribosylformimino-5-aminoimidazole carboxamide ribotide isomerase